MPITKHGMSYTHTYSCWDSMKYRCRSKKASNYSDYGARGIDICPEWCSFQSFWEDMGTAPSDKHSIERIDNNKGYYKNNCYWATAQQQAYNKRNNFMITYNGESKCVSEWAKTTGINRVTIKSRLKRGWSIKDTLTQPSIRVPLLYRKS